MTKYDSEARTSLAALSQNIGNLYEQYKKDLNSTDEKHYSSLDERQLELEILRLSQCKLSLNRDVNQLHDELFAIKATVESTKKLQIQYDSILKQYEGMIVKKLDKRLSTLATIKTKRVPAPEKPILTQMPANICSVDKGMVSSPSQEACDESSPVHSKELQADEQLSDNKKMLLVGNLIKTPHQQIMEDLIAFLTAYQDHFPQPPAREQEQTLRDKMGLLIADLVSESQLYLANKRDFNAFKSYIDQQFHDDLAKELEKHNSIFYPLYCVLVDIMNAFIAVLRAIVNVFAGKEIMTRNTFFKHPEQSLASDVAVLRTKCRDAVEQLNTLEQDAENGMRVAG